MIQRLWLLPLLGAACGCAIFTDDINTAAGSAAGTPIKLLLAESVAATYKAGSETVIPFKVRLVDKSNSAVMGALVHFDSGPLSLQAQTDTTDADGIATSTVTGTTTTPGHYLLTASTAAADGLPDLTLSLPITVEAGEPALLRLLDNEPIANTLCGGTFAAGTASSSPLWVQVVDSYDNPITGVTVRFSVDNATVATSPQLDLTDPLGRAGTTVSASPLSVATPVTLSINIEGVPAPLSIDCDFTVLP